MQDETKHNLDLVDDLRSLGINDTVSLPQIIVVGDQSSGKSSLLEYISGVAFPKSPDLCTRFVTEVRLRDRSPPHMTITYGNEKHIFSDLQEMECFDIEQFIRRNQDGSGEDISEKGIVIEICKPGVKNLTVVDIPGIIHTTMANQDPKAKEVIDNLVHAYASKLKSIILAVIPANKDLATNVVLSVAEKYDPQGNRTIGVITKPDLVDRGTESTVVSIVRGTKKALKLGYYVVRNRSHQELLNGVDLKELKQVEKQFFQRPEWESLDRNRAGIANLMKILSQLLAEHVRSHLPGLKDEVQRKLDALKEKMNTLGDPMDSDQSKYYILFEATGRFHSRMQAYVDGHANNLAVPLITPVTDANGSEDGESCRTAETPGYRGELLKLALQLEEELTRKLPWKQLSDDEWHDHLSTLISVHRGRELSGFLPYNLFVSLIKDIVSYWKSPSMEFLSEVHRLLWKVAEATCNPDGVVDCRVSPHLKNAFYDVFRAQLQKSRESCVEMLENESSWPFTLHPYYTNLVQELTEERNEGGCGQENNVEESSSKFQQYDAGALSILLESYVSAAIKRYVDAFVLYCIEKHLVRDLLREIKLVPKRMNVEEIQESSVMAEIRENCRRDIKTFSKAFDRLSMSSRSSVRPSPGA